MAEVASRRGVAPKLVFWGLAVTFLMALVAAKLIYDKYVAYDRVAHRHVLPRAVLVLRIDLERVATYEPFRTHLLPLVADHVGPEPLKPRLERIKHHCGIELGVDLREFVLATGFDPGRWSIALGGLFPRGGVVEGLHHVLEEEGKASILQEQRLHLPGGSWVSQAADGVTVFASTAGSLDGALTPGETGEPLGLPSTGPVAFALDVTGLSPVERHGLAERLALPLERVDRLAVWLEPGDPDRCQIRLQLPQGVPAGEAKRLLGRVAERFAGLFGVAKSELRTEQANGLPRGLSFPLTGAHLDQGAELLSDVIAGFLGARPRP